MSDSKYMEKGPPTPSVDNIPDKELGNDVDSGEAQLISAGSQDLQRRLKGREVQMFAIGGAIGTSLYVQMGSALPKGGPAGLFIAFWIWGVIMWAVNECFAEMVTLMPVASPFVRFGREYVDEALGFALAWNFFLNMAFLVPFEIVAMNIMITYWTDKVPCEAIICGMILFYALLNVSSVRYFGVTEFYLSIFKVILMIGLFFFTFITMVGGNPQHHAYGFTYWKHPGAFVERFHSGNLGRFLGIVSCMYQASFSICGPEYISMVAAETENPRKVLPSAFKSFIFRILVFFVGSSLCMGIVIPYNDKTLAAILGGEATGSGTGAASPYIIAMGRMGIKVLPHIVNACIMTSIFSSGNGLLFSATRTLHGMAAEGYAPRFLSWCTKAGVPVFALGVSLLFCLLAFLQVSDNSADVLTYLVDLVTCCQLINYGFTAITYRHFYSALKQQGISRDTLPYKGRFQPYTSYLAMGGTLFMFLASGYDLFIHGRWSTMWFFLDYVMIAFFGVLFICYKLFYRTKYVKPGTADIGMGTIKDEIDTYEAMYQPRPSGKVSSFVDRFFFW